MSLLAFTLLSKPKNPRMTWLPTWHYFDTIFLCQLHYWCSCMPQFDPNLVLFLLVCFNCIFHTNTGYFQACSISFQKFVCSWMVFLDDVRSNLQLRYSGIWSILWSCSIAGFIQLACFIQHHCSCPKDLLSLTCNWMFYSICRKRLPIFQLIWDARGWLHRFLNHAASKYCTSIYNCAATL